MTSANPATVSALKEQGEFLRKERKALIARVRKAAADNRDLPICLLAERFGLTESEVEHITRDIPRDRDGFSNWLGRHPRRRKSA